MIGGAVDRPLRRRARRAGLLSAVVAACWLAACAGAPYQVITLSLDDPAPATLGPSPDDLTIARIAARLFRERLGLPLPGDTTVRLYVNQATFAEGLARDGGLEVNDAWDRSRFAGGVASPRGIFLRADSLVRMPLLHRVGVIAHELAHVSQMQMRRGGRGAPEAWVREGHADWVKFQVLDFLGYRSYAESRSETWRVVLRSTTPVRFFPPLEALERGAQWTDATIRLRSAATYGQAFLAIDWLVERYGIDQLHEFLRRFALAAEPRSHWSAVYPVSLAEFSKEFREQLGKLVE